MLMLYIVEKKNANRLCVLASLQTAEGLWKPALAFCCGIFPLQAAAGHFEKGFGICETEGVRQQIKLERKCVSPGRWTQFSACELYLEQLITQKTS